MSRINRKDLIYIANEYPSINDVAHVLITRVLLSQTNKSESFWLWNAIERIVKGEKETEVLKEYGYHYGENQ